MTDLRESHRSGKQSVDVELKVGDVVLVKEDNVKRNCWKLGKVEKLVVCMDGVVRGAKLRVLTNGKPVVLSRPLQNPYPLAVGCGQRAANDLNTGTGDGANASEGVRKTPKRAAAIDSVWKTRVMLDTQP